MTSVHITITSSESSNFDIPLQSYKKKLGDLFSDNDGSLDEEEISTLLIPLVLNQIIRKNIDIDDVVYDVISDFDYCYSEDSDYYDEEDTDMKDNIRDIILSTIGFNSCSSLVLDCDDKYLKKKLLGTKI